jgi:hypothetical protein
MRRLYLTLVSLLFIFGCSKGPVEKAPVEINVFSFSQVTDAFSGAGNFRLYAKSPSNNLQFGTDISRYSSTNTDLEFGQWELNVVGWDTADYTGTTYCGKAIFNIPEDILDGKLTITVTEAGCADPFWSPLDHMTSDGKFQKLKISFCDSKFELNALTDWNSECDVDARSFKIGFIDYEKQPIGSGQYNEANTQYSSCMNLDPNQPTSEMRLPLGNFGNRDIKYVIRGYAGSNCPDSSTEKIILPVTQGMLSSALSNNIRIFPGHSGLPAYQQDYLAININIAFIEQIGMRMSPTKINFGDRLVGTSDNTKTVTIYNESAEDLLNCTLSSFNHTNFKSPDFDKNCNSGYLDVKGDPTNSGIPFQGTCTFKIQADLSSANSGDGLSSPLVINCEGGARIATNDEGVLVCPGGSCNNGNFEGDIEANYIPKHLGEVVVNELPDSNNGGNEITFRNTTEETTFTNCFLTRTGTGADAFPTSGFTGNQSPTSCLSNLSPGSECRVELTPRPTIIGDQEVNIGLNCDGNDNKFIYLENTTKVTGVYPFKLQGAPFFGRYASANDAPVKRIRLSNESANMKTNCQVFNSNNTDFEFVDRDPNDTHSSTEFTDFCGETGNTRSVVSDNECTIGLIPKAGSNGPTSTRLDIYCSGELSGSFNYTAERTGSALGDIVVDQQATAFNPVEIPYNGDGQEERIWINYRNNTNKTLYGCRTVQATSSSAEAAVAIYASKHYHTCSTQLHPGESCQFSYVPSRYPSEGEGALNVGSHSVSYRMDCDDFASGSLTTVSSTNASLSINVTDNDGVFRVSPNWIDLGNSNDINIDETLTSSNIQVTNVSGGNLTGCQTPVFYDNGNEVSNLTVVNSNCPSNFANGDQCTFQVQYTDDDSDMKVTAEMEIRCDDDKSIRTSSNFVVNYNNGGGNNHIGCDQQNNDLCGTAVYGFNKEQAYSTGDNLFIYVYTNSKVDWDSGSGYHFYDWNFGTYGGTNTGNGTFNYDDASSSENRLAFKYTVQPGDSFAGNLASPTIYFNGGPIYTEPESGITYHQTQFNFDGGGNIDLYINEVIPPKITSITSSSPDQTYTTGQEVLIDVNYNESVQVLGFQAIPDLTVNCTVSTNTVTRATGTADFNSLGLWGNTVRINGNSYDIQSVDSSTQVTLVQNCGDTYSGRPMERYYTPSLGVSLAQGSGGLSIKYDAAFDSNPTDNILTFKLVVPSGGFAGSELQYDSAYGNMTFGVVSDANGAEAAHLNGCSDLPSGNCLSDNTNFVFESLPTITNISSPTSDTIIKRPGDIIHFNVTFSENVTVGDVSAVKLRFRDDANTVSSDADLDPTSNNGTDTLSFTWTVPDNFYAADLDGYQFIAFAAQISAVSSGQPVQNIFPLGADAGSLQNNKNFEITRGYPEIINITANDVDGVYNSGSQIDVRVTFSEQVGIVNATNVDMFIRNQLTETDHQVNLHSNGGSLIVFRLNVPSGFYAADLDVESFVGLTNNVYSQESGLYVLNDSDFPKGVATTGSLANNKNFELGSIPRITSISRNDTNGDITVDSTDLEVNVTFDQSVTVSGGGPKLVYKTDAGTDEFLTYISGSGGNTLLFRKTFYSTDITAKNTQDLNLVFMNGSEFISNSENVSYLQALDNNFDIFPVGTDSRSLSSNENIVIGSKATVLSIDANGIADGVANNFVPGDTIDIYVRFSEAMAHSSANPAGTSLTVKDNSGSDVTVPYLSGVNSDTWIYRLTVPSNMDVADLDISGFSGFASIEKFAASGNYVALTIPKGIENPGSLISNAHIVIGELPSIVTGTGIETTTNTPPFVTGDTIILRANYSSAVNVDPANYADVKIEFLDIDNNPVYAYIDPASLPSSQPLFNFEVPDRMNITDLMVSAVHGLQYLVQDKSKIPVNSYWPIGQGVQGALADNYDLQVGGPEPQVSSMVINSFTGNPYATVAAGPFYGGNNVILRVTLDTPIKVDSEDVGQVKLKLDDGSGNFSFATLGGPITTPSTIIDLDWLVPYQNFATNDLKVVEVLGAEHIYNPASNIPLNVTSDALNLGANSLAGNFDIAVIEIPSVVSFEENSTPNNGSEYLAPTQPDDKLVVRVKFDGPVDVVGGNENLVKLKVADNSANYVDGDLVLASISDGDPNSLDFEFTFPAAFGTNDLRVNTFNGFTNVVASGTSVPVEGTGYPQGPSEAGSLEADYDIVVTNEIKVTNVIGSIPDNSGSPSEYESISVDVFFSNKIKISDADKHDPFLRANGDNGQFIEGRLDLSSVNAAIIGGAGHNSARFIFDVPPDFSTPDLAINFIGNFDKFTRVDDSFANINLFPMNGAPDSLSANNTYNIITRDSMTEYGSGVDGDINLNMTVDLSSDAASDLVQDHQGYPKYPISYFKVESILHSTQGHPHFIIDIKPSDDGKARNFLSSDSDPNNITTIDQDDLVMWYVNSEKFNGCGNNLKPGMYGFIQLTMIENDTRGRFGVAPGTSSSSVLGGGFLPTAELPTFSDLNTPADSMDNGVELPKHCSMQLVRVFMPRVLELGTSALIEGTQNSSFDIDTGVGGIIPIKVSEVINLMGRGSTPVSISGEGMGFHSVGYNGFSGHTGSHISLIPTFRSTAGVSLSGVVGGGGAGWRSGGDSSENVDTGGQSPEARYCSGNCYPSSAFNETNYLFMGSPGSAPMKMSKGGGVVILHGKKIENGYLNINNAGITSSGGGAGGGSVYLDFETVNQFGAAANDVTFNIVANGADGEYINPEESGGGGGGGGHINIQVCNNNNNGTPLNTFNVMRGTPAGPSEDGLSVDGLNSGTECIKVLPR